MSHTNNEKAFLIEALQWHLDHGVDEAVLNEPLDRTVPPPMPKAADLPAPSKAGPAVVSAKSNVLGFQEGLPQSKPAGEVMGTAQAIVQAQKLAADSSSLEELSSAITAFDGLSVKKTASNMVFCDGNPKSKIMLIGEAPGADEDIQGKPFVGASGQLLDRILACINLARTSDDAEKAIYISNILNWRPPGNRTPTQAEIDISLPFIERHIALIQPKMIILCGGVAAKGLLRRSESISKLRGTFHDYLIPSELGGNGQPIPAVATYHPAYLLRTPSQKKAVWADMLMIQERYQQILS